MDIKITYEEIVKAVNNYNNENDTIFLEGLTSKDNYIKWHSIKGCGLKKIYKAIPTLIKILGTPCPTLGHTDSRRIAAWALAEMGFNSFAQYLKKVDTINNPLLKEGLADTLGITNDIRALPYLNDLMNDRNSSVILWTSLSLSKFGDVSLPIIKEHLIRTKGFKKAAYLLDALLKIGSSEAKEIYQEFIESTKIKGIRENKRLFIKNLDNISRS